MGKWVSTARETPEGRLKGMLGLGDNATGLTPAPWSPVFDLINTFPTIEQLSWTHLNLRAIRTVHSPEPDPLPPPYSSRAVVHRLILRPLEGAFMKYIPHMIALEGITELQLDCLQAFAAEQLQGILDRAHNLNVLRFDIDPFVSGT